MKKQLLNSIIAAALVLAPSATLHAGQAASSADLARKSKLTKYTVVFNANGGKGKTAAQAVVYGQATRLRPNGFKRSGYVFIGWSRQRNGAVAYANQAAVRNLANPGKKITLYAQWARSAYRMAFYANGGAGTMPPQTIAYGKATPLSANKFTKSGYGFQGWAKTPEGAIAYKNGQAVKNLVRDGSTIKLYARWSRSTYKVAFNANGGVGTMAIQKIPREVATNLRTNCFTRQGFTFTGWATSAAGAVAYGNGQTVKNLAATGATANLFAVWAKKPTTPATNSTTGSSAAPGTAATPSPDEVGFSQLQWKYGGFNGGAAALENNTRIGKLQVNSGGLSYAWTQGGCEKLGASSSTDANCVACLFCHVGGAWIGGKFDWISTSQGAKDFTNIKTAYKGWTTDAIEKADAYAFVIVSRDGKKRSNVIRCGKSGTTNTTATTPATGTTATASSDEVSFAQLKWSWGGFKGGAAALEANTRISKLKVSSGGLSYSWAKGGCERLGATSSTDANCVACLFCKIGKEWVGGKFDWVSTSRLTRDFKNIRTSYNGWSPDAIEKATEYAFVIVSRDGKKRSNVIRCGK